jgi:hypothetical protein
VTLGISAARAQSFLETLRGTTYTGIATPFVQLHTADPGAAGTTSISAGSTTRNAISWNAYSAGSITLLSLGLWTNGGTTETISHVSIWTAATVGAFVQSFALTTPQPWVSTNQLNLSTFTVSASPIAA